MSSIFSELRRSERLLPVEGSASFQRISSWRPLLVDVQKQPALYEHVAFFRGDAQRGSKWMYTIRSSRVSTRQVPFINFMPRNVPGATAPQGAAIGGKSLGGDASDDVPPTFMCKRHIEALAPYECLMCPTLLLSPLRPSCTWRISRIAAQLSLPAQEVFLFFSMMLVYLDVIVETMFPKPLNFQELSDVVDKHYIQRFLPVSKDGEEEDARWRPFTVLLRSAIALWKERREATVAASVSLGFLATALCLRDIHDMSYHAFVPSAPRDAVLENHPFRLPPLADDTLVVHFVPTWERVLQAAHRDTSLLANLHEYLSNRNNECMAAVHLYVCRHPTMAHIFTSLSDLPLSCEELADFVCRLGASLWSSPDMAKSIVLSKVQSNFVIQVIREVFFATSLRLQHRGIHELRVRRVNLTDLALTVIQDDGREREVGHPAGFYAGRTAMGDTALKNAGTSNNNTNINDRNCNNLPLWLVTAGGLDVARTFLRHLIQGRRPIKLPMVATPPSSYCDDAGVETDDREKIVTTTTTTTTSTVAAEVGKKGEENMAEQPFVALTRAEEGILYRIFQSHGAALQLTGCGIQQLHLRATDGQLILRRVCGATAAWDLRDCYDTEDTSKLRHPPRIVTANRPLPLPEGVLPARVTLRGVRGMIQHYWRAILVEQKRATLSGFPSVRGTTLFPIDKVVALHVLRHHPQYHTKLRGCGIVEICVQQQQQKQEGKEEQRRSSTDGGRDFRRFQPDGEGVEDGCKQVEEDTSGHVPTLVIIRPCGSSSVFAYEDCFCPVTGGLRRPQILESGGGEAGAVRWSTTLPLLSSSRSRKRSLSRIRD